MSPSLPPECIRFRSALERVAAGPPAELAELARDPHPHGCATCRRELEREVRLDRVLLRDPAPSVPADLAARVLAALAPRRGTDELDALLARLPDPQVPVGLAQRVLHGVAPARPPAPSDRAARPPASRTRWVAVAAALLVGLGLWGWLARDTGPEEDLVASTLESDPELVAYALEQWELLNDEDLDVWLACLDPTEELLLEYADGEIWLEEPLVSPGTARDEGGD